MFTGEDIRKKRKKLDLSVKELADLLSVKVDNLYKWEKGTKPSDPEDFIKIESWLKGKPLESIPNNGVENVPKENFPALSPPVPDTPLPGTATLQDLIAEKEAHRKSVEAHLQKAEAEKDRLYGIIEGYLSAILTNSVQSRQVADQLKAQADIIIKQLARADMQKIEAMLKKNLASDVDKVKGGKGNHNVKKGSKV